jgi:hypothetical protein
MRRLLEGEVPSCFRYSFTAACMISLLAAGCRSDSREQTPSPLKEAIQELTHNPFTPKPEPISTPGPPYVTISKSSPFAAYDEPIANLIEKNWYQILDNDHSGAAAKRGLVVATFELHSDGTITDIKVTKSTVGEEYVSACEKAISMSFPYKPWPEEMRKKIQKDSGSDLRDISFTFKYEE